MKLFETLEFPEFKDSRGALVPFEFGADFPFEVKRVYLVTSKEGQVRGGHAHIMESEVFVAAAGSVTAVVNDGRGDQSFVLGAKNKALLVRPHCWHEFKDFSDDAVLLCFSSTHYYPGEENYIMDKSKFLGA